MEHFFERHVLHSLGIAKIQAFNSGAKILDVGTGGGFPGIPLAIMFPETEFLLVDSIGKKIKVVKAVAEELKLPNIRAIHSRAEEINEKFDFIVSRAVTALPDFIKWIEKNTIKENKHKLKNGILYLKGGDLDAELVNVKHKISIYELKSFFKEDFFETKKVVHVEL
jgi:16S rRNA (guanine527-N7)-methyltransferase